MTAPSPFRAKRRRFIAVVSLCVFAALGLIALGVGLFATQSETGQTLVRESLESRVKASINGKIHIGNIRGNFLTGVTIDSVEMRDDEDSLFFAVGKITLRYDPRDLVDRRLYFRSVDLEHPTVVLREHENWQWNYRRIFKIKPNAPQQKKGPERGFGDFVVLDSVHIRNGGSFRLTIPWHADDSLHGARLDSAIRVNVARKDHEIRRSREGVTQTYSWTKAYAFISHARINDPDSAGQQFIVDTLHVDESMPRFKWRNIAGVVKVRGDSAWNQISHWDLPGSTGHASGKVWWGSDLPVRYDMHIVGDSVQLADVDWVYPTLPTTGGGKMVLEIKNEKDLNKIDYVIHDMDVRSTKSHLLGQMTFDVGGPVLSVHDVKLTADNVDFDLLRTLNGKPFPADWQGKINGTVVARGGPLTNFYVDAANLTFNDAHVKNAVSQIQGHGELDILYPAFTAFHGFSASTNHFDVRTLVAIYPPFPRVTGILSGSAVLDSSWLDVRVSNADLTHTDGPAEPTHATGSGRITYGVEFMNYDLTLQASPLSLTTLNVSYPKMALRGPMYGPIHVKGIAPDLDVQADLTGPAGHITFIGKVDADSIGSYGAKGSGIFDALEAGMLLGYSSPRTQLAGRYEAALVGDSVANLDGPLFVQLGQSNVEGNTISSGGMRMRFEHGIVRVDSTRVDGTAGVLHAVGTLGITRSAGADSLSFEVDVDSLGGLRRYLGKVPPVRGKVVARDSLAGALSFNGVARGWLDSLDVHGSLDGTGIFVRGDKAHVLNGTLAIRDVREKLTGVVSLRADTAVASGVRIDELTFGANILDAGHAIFAGGARGENGATLRAQGNWRTMKDTTVVQLDTLNLGVGTSRWALKRPSVFTQSPFGITLDTLLFADAAGARVAGFINAPTSAPVRAKLRVDSIPLADIGQFAQLPSALAGRLSLDLDVAGTSNQPVMTLAARTRGLTYAGLSAEVIDARGAYSGERASLDANVLRGGRSLLDANISYPVALTLFSARITDDSLRGRVHADSVELALIEALTPKVRNSKGNLALDLALSGRPDDWHVGGYATVKDGSAEIPDAGVRLGALDGAISVDAVHDSMTIDRLSWTSPASGGTASLGGSVVFHDRLNPRLALRFDARNFRAVDKKNLARLDISTGSTGLTLAGTPDAATLSGAVNVDRGTIYIPELVRKQLVDLTPEDFAQLFDTTDVRNRSLMPQPPGALVEHLALSGVSVHLGEDVWLRSREANIKLGGSLNVTRTRDEHETTRSTLGRDVRTDSARYKLALSGSLSADRGTYTLDLTAVQREFQVQSGRITFFGTADFNPEIDVSALYQVKQANRADIGIKARIHGNFYPQPALELSSTDAYLSPSDLVSYLVTGRPSFDLATSEAQQRALEFVLPTLGASVSRALRDQLGGFVDLFQIQSGAVSDPLDKSGTTTPFRSFLSSTRLGGEKQIRDRLFLSFSTGLCFTGSDDPNQTTLSGFAQSIEGKFEYRFPLLAPDRLALRAGLDPAASALRCGRSVPRGFASTPTQFGFSLFRSWVF